MTRIAIDLNVRVRGQQTYAGFEDVLDGDHPHPGDFVEVFERESGVFGKAQVTDIDSDRELIYLAVDWAHLAEPTVPHFFRYRTATAAAAFVEGPAEDVFLASAGGNAATPITGPLAQV